MSKSGKKNFIKSIKRDVLPRKAKEQSAVNLNKLAVIMEVIEVWSAVEDNVFKEVAKICKKRTKPKQSKARVQPQKNYCEDIKGSPHILNNSKIQEESRSLNDAEEPETSRGLSKAPGGLSHFMELGERTDLLCNTPLADPLGPDGCDHFQWVEIKKESFDDIELCNVKLTELPLKLDEDHHVEAPCIPLKFDSSSADELAFSPTLVEPTTPITVCNEIGSLPDEVEVDRELWDVSSCEDDYLESQENEQFMVDSIKKKRKTRTQDCDKCGKKLSSKGSLRMHKLKKHKEKIQFACDLCNLKFDLQRQVVQHRNSEHREDDGRFCCKVCNKRFSEYYSFLPHIKNHLDSCKEEEGSDKHCSECQKTFQDDESLRTHQTLTHTIDEKSLRDKLRNQDKNLICHTCGKRFAFNCLLRDHINLHTGAKPYLCQQCGKAFSQKATLKQHTKTHNEIRPYQCSECPVGFYSGGDLKKHLRKHTGERPYVCEVCGEGFSRNSHLMVHRRSHTGERPHNCDVCGRGFTKRGDVVRHRRIHTGELPYLCQVCGKAFRQSTQCANHIKSQHPDVPVIVARNPNPLYQSV